MWKADVLRVHPDAQFTSECKDTLVGYTVAHYGDDIHNTIAVYWNDVRLQDHYDPDHP